MARKTRSVVLGLGCVVTLVISAALGGPLGSMAHAAKMTPWTKYHNATYDYTLTYPATWRIHTQLSAVILDNGAAGPCQVDVQVDQEAGCTSALRTKPVVSTSRWRLRPFTFLPPS
jgi:hypothetical protein